MRREKIKLLVSDMDGTLFRSDKSISPYTLDVLSRIRQNGLIFTINTGRNYNWLGGYRELLSLDCPIICGNGCEIAHGLSGKRYFTASLSKNDAESCFRFCIKHKLTFFAETPEHWVLPDYIHNMDPFPGFHPELPLTGFSYDRIISASNAADSDAILKVLIWVTHGNEGELLAEFASSMPDVELLHSASDIYELIPVGVNKGSSFFKLCSILNVSPEECCSFGDFDNDLPMLNASGISVAMANAPKYIREQADFVTDNNNSDGVAKAIEEIFLN